MRCFGFKNKNISGIFKGIIRIYGHSSATLVGCANEIFAKQNNANRLSKG